MCNFQIKLITMNNLIFFIVDPVGYIKTKNLLGIKIFFNNCNCNYNGLTNQQVL